MRTKLSVACALVALALPAPASAVVGGAAVKAGGYSFAVAVGDSTGPYCGGTLIAPRVVLTAAHCLTIKPTSLGQLRVFAGSHSITADLATHDATHVMGLTAVVVHPKFNEQSMHYDAALLILDHPVASARILPMAKASPLAGSSVSAAGWGTTEEHGAVMRDQLRSVILKVGTTRACARGNAIPGGYFAPSMMCASNPGRDTCSGDSGGPLVGTNDGHTVMVGITSFGFGCAKAGHPGVYTRVTGIRAWTLAQLDIIAAAFPNGG
jgi:secreted trypsin-like serine protease